MKLKQLSLFLENKPGALSAPMRTLAAQGLNITTLSIADTQNFGILRLILRDWEKARALLQQNGFVVKVTDVVAIEVPDKPGGLAEILATLEGAGINVEYMYAFTLKKEDKGVLVFRFDDPDRAVAAIQQHKINMVSDVELFRRAHGE
jgi:hypothetical protein